MIKTILVPTSGSSTDDQAFATALALARPLAAHLNFLHLRLSAGEAAAQAPHVEFCVGAALTDALSRLKQQEANLSSSAASHFKTFCKAKGIPFSSVPGRSDIVTASWQEESNRPSDRLLYQARHSDLIVMGRRRHVDNLPPGLIEEILIHSGRPLVLAPDRLTHGSIDTVVVGWKEAPESARALAVALPILERVRRVVLIGVSEGDGAIQQTLNHLMSQLAWHGIAAETRVVLGNARDASTILTQIAADVRADLLVIGGFGHGPTRELIFGGVTQDLIDRADLPVFMMH